MGYDATCSLTIDGHTTRGTACLEHKDLIFRGPTRLAIPLKDITDARADGGTLHVTFGSRHAAFEIGDAAARWAERITNPPSRLDKLGVKAGMRVALVGVQDQDFEQELALRGAAVTRRVPAAGQGLDMLFYAVHTRADLARLDAFAAAIAPAGAVWVLRPKGRHDLTEADTMAAGKKAGLVDVKVVSFSDTTSAEKFVIPVAKRAQPRRSSSPAPRRS